MMVRHRIANFFLDFFKRFRVYCGPLEWFIFCINSLNGVDRDAKFGMNLLNWLIDPINDLISLIQFGSFRFLIASDLCISGVVPFASILNPNHSML